MAEAVILLAVKKIGVALANEATSQATSYFRKFVTQLTELQGSMGRIRRELRLMHEFLSRMDVRNRNNHTDEIWVEEVRMLVHRIEDIVDDYLHLVGHKHDAGWGTYLKKGFKRPNVLFSLNTIASSIKDAEASLVHLFQAKERWVWMSGSVATSNKSSSYIVETSRHLASISRSLDEDLVGMDVNREKLHELLTSDELQREVIALYGMGGLGKTALAANVYRNDRENFQCHAWVSISQTFFIKDVLKCLITELDVKKKIRGDIGDVNTGRLQDMLKEFLMDRKYLIVLDDVWEPEAVNDLFGMLVPNLKGSRVIVTTRIDGVAHLAFPDKRITLEPLSKRESWKLFCQTTFSKDREHECPAKLTKPAQQIVSKCKGIPLAIVSVSRLLFVREKTEEEFRRVLNQLDWEIINNPSLEHVRNILYLSYIYLPTHLKSCFLYCSLFPEDYLFKRKNLIRWWVAEGFIENRGGSTMEEVAEGYIKELVHRNMPQLIARNPFGRIKLFRMHDIVRELAVDLCRRECFGRSYSCENKHGKFLQEKDERRVVIHKLEKDINQVVSSGSRSLRSLIALYEDMPSSTQLPLVANKCRYMSVLELSGLSIEIVPDAIGDLFNLRHLGLRDSKVKLLPKSIEKLSNLLTLDLFRSQIQEVPKGIVKLKKLRQLFAEKVNDRCGRQLPCRTGVQIHNGLEKLMELQTLQGLEVRDEESARQLRELRQLRSIKIWDVKERYCEVLCESLNKMEFLSFLSICASGTGEVLNLDGLNPLPQNLQKLWLGGRLAGKLFDAVEGQDQNNHSLYSVSLSWSQLKENPLPSLSRLLNLAELWLTNAYIGEDLVFCKGWFPNLKELYLRDMPNLKRLEIQQGAIICLQLLQLTNLRGITEVPSGIESIPTLKDLYFTEITPGFVKALRECDRIAGRQWWYSLR